MHWHIWCRCWCWIYRALQDMYVRLCVHKCCVILCPRLAKNGAIQNVIKVNMKKKNAEIGWKIWFNCQNKMLNFVQVCNSLNSRNENNLSNLREEHFTKSQLTYFVNSPGIPIRDGNEKLNQPMKLNRFPHSSFSTLCTQSILRNVISISYSKDLDLWWQLNLAATTTTTKWPLH